MKNRLLDQFYTKNEVALDCVNKVKDIIQQNNVMANIWLEPSAGTGAFFNLLPDNKLGFDIEPRCSGVIEKDFLLAGVNEDNCITIGNPPFGKNSSLAIKFFNKAAMFSSLIAFIVPKTFKKDSVIEKLNNNFHLIYECDIPKFSFIFNEKDYDVPCVFQVWKKESIKRVTKQKILTNSDFQFTNKDKASIAIQRVGVNAGKVKRVFDNCAIASHYFIKATEDIIVLLEKIDWSTVKYNTAGNPSISKRELIDLYEKVKNNKNEGVCEIS